MLRKLSNSFFLNKNLIRQVGSRFSSHPQPNQNKQQPEKTPDIDPPSVEPPEQPKKQDHSKIRAQARIYVCRSQLNKFAKAEVDYEKLNIPTKQMQRVQKVLDVYGIKIKHVVDQGPLIEFHRLQQIKRKPRKQQRNDKQRQTSQEAIQEEEEDIKLEFKIYTRPFKQLVSRQGDGFERYFATPDDLLGQMSEQTEGSGKGGDIFGVPKKRAVGSFSRRSFKQYRNFYDLIKDFNELQTNFRNKKKEQEEDVQNVDRFKEFTLYMRDARKQGTKWVKFQLMIEDWIASHFYRVSLVDNAEQDAKGLVKSSHQYMSPLAKDLDKQVLQLLKLSFESIQEIDPIMFLPIYYYTGLREHECYRKWLDDMVELTR